MPKGRLEVIVGCMSSGKSEELIRRLRRSVIAGQRAVVFKPAHDTRTDGVTIASRDGRRHDAVSVRSASEMLELADGHHQVVGVDEIHFFDEDLVHVAGRLVDRGVRVIAAGLDTDFRGKPFGIVPDLMAVADEVAKLHAVCVRCGANATRSQLLIAPPSDDLTSPDFVGGDEKYEARCRDCHEPQGG